jgi:hypothetical protein
MWKEIHKGTHQFLSAGKFAPSGNPYFANGATTQYRHRWKLIGSDSNPYSNSKPLPVVKTIQP